MTCMFINQNGIEQCHEFPPQMGIIYFTCILKYQTSDSTNTNKWKEFFFIMVTQWSNLHHKEVVAFIASGNHLNQIPKIRQCKCVVWNILTSL